MIMNTDAFAPLSLLAEYVSGKNATSIRTYCEEIPVYLKQ